MTEGKRMPRSKGRPIGTKNKLAAMPLNKRLKVLQKIALDNNQKATDRIAAINLITQLLNDKIKDAETDSLKTIIEFKQEKKENNSESAAKQTENKKEEAKTEDVEEGSKETILSGNVSSQVSISEPLKKEEAQVNVLELNFSFEEDNANTNGQSTTFTI